MQVHQVRKQLGTKQTPGKRLAFAWWKAGIRARTRDAAKIKNHLEPLRQLERSLFN